MINQYMGVAPLTRLTQVLWLENGFFGWKKNSPKKCELVLVGPKLYQHEPQITHGKVSVLFCLLEVRTPIAKASYGTKNSFRQTKVYNQKSKFPGGKWHPGTLTPSYHMIISDTVACTKAKIPPFTLQSKMAGNLFQYMYYI